MHARVATFEGGDPVDVREAVTEIRGMADERGGPPDGVPATGFLLLHDPGERRVLAISLFETEEDMRKGAETLDSMDPPTPGALGQRTSVGMYEVGAKFEAEGAVS